MLYVRHSEKSYKNGASERFPLDPNLTVYGRKLAQSRFEELVESYGPPELIISSPYLRTRETAEIAQQVILEATGTHVDIHYDPFIGEYLGNQKSISLEEGVTPETLALDPVHHETLEQYRSRVRQHVRGLNPLRDREPVRQRGRGSGSRRSREQTTTRRGREQTTTRRGREQTTTRCGREQTTTRRARGSDDENKHSVSQRSDSYVKNPSIESQPDPVAKAVMSPVEDISIDKDRVSGVVCSRWYISHGMVIKSIAHFNGVEVRYPKYLGGIVIKDGSVTAI